MPEIVLPNAPAEPDLDAPIWRLVITDLAGNPIGEIIDAYERKFHFALRSPETIQCKLNLDNAMLPYILAEPYIHLWKLYRRTKLMMVGETTSWEFVIGEDQLTRCAFNATSCFWPRLSKRLIGKSREGVSHDGSRSDFIVAQLSALNAINDTRLRPGVVSAASPVQLSGWRYKPFLEAIQELAFTVNGFDFYPTPVEPSTGVVGHVNISPWWGTGQANAIFEYGGGRANLRDWSWKGDNTNRINDAYALPASYPDNAGLQAANYLDAPSRDAIGLREALVSSDLNDPSLRALLTQEHTTIRKNARQIFTFNPHFDDGAGRVPQFGIDFGIGDTIAGRVDDQGIIWLDGNVRVYGADIEISEEGRETTSLTLVSEEAA